MNRFPRDFRHDLTGFGGDPNKNKAEHRADIQKTPVILVHGNGGNSVHYKWGMQPMADFLKHAGYKPSEIWAMDYLGEDNEWPDLDNPHTRHIEAFRTFVDRVKDYLGVDKLDFIAHSLGCGMVNAYMRGLQPDGQWRNDDRHDRLRFVGTFVSLSGATYGLFTDSDSEFGTDSSFVENSRTYKGIIDDTPHGANDISREKSPERDWKNTTPLDDNTVRYVAVIAARDFVDEQNKDTSRREGADLNKRFHLGPSIMGHEQIIKNRTVFHAFKDYLNQYPPKPRATISIDRRNGKYGSNLQVTVTVDRDVSIGYTAERITKKFHAGSIIRTVADRKSGTLLSGQSFILAPDGAWEVVFSAPGADDVVRTYGVTAGLPKVTILTDNRSPFQGSLAVQAATTEGTLYHSLDGRHWNEGSVVTITETATVDFIAVDSNGVASAVVSRAFEKELGRSEGDGDLNRAL